MRKTWFALICFAGLVSCGEDTEYFGIPYIAKSPLVELYVSELGETIIVEYDAPGGTIVCWTFPILTGNQASVAKELHQEVFFFDVEGEAPHIHLLLGAPVVIKSLSTDWVRQGNVEIRIVLGAGPRSGALLVRLAKNPRSDTQ